MRRLILMRHAKAVLDDGDIADIERPLNRRGREAVPLIARALVAAEFVPDFIACSTATRTVETLDLVLAELPKKPELRYEDALYLARAAVLIERARWFPQSAATAMIVAHNPGMHEAAFALARKARSDPEQACVDLLSSKFPTGSAAIIEFSVRQWRDIAAKTGELVAFLRPRDLG